MFILNFQKEKCKRNAPSVNPVKLKTPTLTEMCYIMQVALVVKNLWVQSLRREDPLEEDMATHFSIPDWEIQWTENPGGLKSTGSSDMTEVI